MAKQNVEHFRNILSGEKQFLAEQCKIWQAEISDPAVTDDAAGEIRTAIGLTELLLNKKLKQFSGLIDDCEFKNGEKETTCDDLQGYWDMVCFEVEKVKRKFEDLQKLKSSGWKIDENISIPLKKPKIKNPAVKRPQESSSSAKAHILAARKRLAEAKANAAKDKENDSESFVVIRVPKQIENFEEKPKKSSEKTKEKKRQDIKVKKIKEIIPLQCVTRAAKKALAEQNKVIA